MTGILSRLAAWTAGAALLGACHDGRPSPVAPSVEDPDPPRGWTPAPGPAGLWIDYANLAQRPTAGPAWDALQAAARGACGVPDLADQDDGANVCVLAKALVSARIGSQSLRDEVAEALRAVAGTSYRGRALALGRELAAYVIAADLVQLSHLDPALDAQFRSAIRNLLTAPTLDGPTSLVDCHETRPNNWGTHCGASRAAVAAYLGDTGELSRVAAVFRGYLGDRASYAGFVFGRDLSWQCDPSQPVGLNPRGCSKQGRPLGGVLPDDQRRAGSFRWPPPRENYVYEALQGMLVQAAILQRAGYPDVFTWEESAPLRAFEWLQSQAAYPPRGDDEWAVHLVNAFYGTHYPAPVPAMPGKNMGWTDYTHAR